MKIVEVRGFGGPERLAWVDQPTPEPGPGEVRIRVAACGLNHADLLMRQGTYLGGPRPPFHPGMEAAGTVDAIGGDAPTDLHLGSRVALLAGDGLQATHVVVPADACVAIPDDLPFEQAAALPVAYLTAYHALVTVARAQPGEVVLIHGAAGGLGTAAVQIAARLGLQVIATASSDEKRLRVMDLGAEHATDYPGFERVVRKVAGRAPDIILEMIGGDILRRSLRLLPPLGRLVLLGMVSQQPHAIDSVQLLFRSQAVLGFHLRSLLGQDQLVAESLGCILRWIAAGDITVDIGKVLPLSEIRQAHELLASRAVHGKIVLVT